MCTSTTTSCGKERIRRRGFGAGLLGRDYSLLRVCVPTLKTQAKTLCLDSSRQPQPSTKEHLPGGATETRTNRCQAREKNEELPPPPEDATSPCYLETGVSPMTSTLAGVEPSAHAFSLPARCTAAIRLVGVHIKAARCCIIASAHFLPTPYSPRAAAGRLAIRDKPSISSYCVGADTAVGLNI